MDMTRIITAGRMERTLDMNGMTIKIATPAYVKPTDGTPDPVEILSRHIIQIDDEMFTTPESKAKLRSTFSSAQSVLINKLLEEVNKLIEEQVKVVEELVTKKD